MIKVNPRVGDGVYEIIWEPVKNVNHGLVSYTVKVLEKDIKGDSLVSICLYKYYYSSCLLIYCYLFNSLIHQIL